MGIESVFTIIFIVFIVTGVVFIIAGFNFDNQYRKEYKGANKAEYIKFNKIGSILMGGIMLLAALLGIWLPVFKGSIVLISSVCLIIMSIIFSIISKKKFSIENN